MTTGADSGQMGEALPGTVVHTEGGPRLVAGCCTACGKRVFPPPKVCPNCLGEDIASEHLPEHGTLYTHTTVHVGRKGWPSAYTVGFVDFGDVRVSGPIDEGPDAPIKIGGKVRLDYGQLREDPAEGLLSSHRFVMEAAP